MADVSPFSLLVDELKTEDIEAKTRAIRKIKTVAAALGPDRTRDELLPLINESTDDEDEVLLLLAEQIGFLVDMIGGAAHVPKLLIPLEALAAVEETVVREKATESIAACIAAMDTADCGAVAQLVGRLAAGDWFTSRISACSLVAPACAKCNEADQVQLRTIFASLSGDETPMVKRAAASQLGAFAQAVSKDVLLSEVVGIFSKQAKDDQDSVRLLAIEACVPVASLLSEAENEEHVLPIVHASVEDRSWRVRYNMAKMFHPLSAAMGTDITMRDMLGSFLNLLQDAEAEVRTAATKNVAGYCELVGVEVFVQEVMPVLQVLFTDTVQSVRTALSTAVMGVAGGGGFSQDLAGQHLVPLVSSFLRDESPEVRLNILKELSLLKDWIAAMQDEIMPSVLQLVNDSHWRVRLAIVEQMPLFMGALGTPYFTSNLLPPLLATFGDTVAHVRVCSADMLAELAEAAGHDWIQANVMPSLKESWEASSYYLQRITVLRSCEALAKAKVGGQLLNDVTELVLKGLSDSVPNVRFSACKTAETLVGILEPAGVLPIKTKLEALTDDGDVDVVFYSRSAVEACS